MTLKDFKSFGGTHHLPFGRGMTVIVGPNGSGKSNILDGLRWVLGESGAARLRITRQSDLHFQGSTALPEADETHVTLTLADEDRRVTLIRGLDSAGGTVTVDGSKIRLGDLADVKAGWGFGGDRFAFIGQGEITSQIGLRPFARRLALEELFGVDRYRVKREEGSRRLDEAEAELTRLRALAAELETRRAEIAPDLQKARQAADLESRIAGLTARVYHLRRLAEEERLEGLADEARSLEGQIARSAWWLKTWSALAGTKQTASGEVARRREEAQQKLSALLPRREELARSLGEVTAGLERDESRGAGLTEDLERAKGRAEESAARRDAEAQESGRLAEEERRCAERADELESRFLRHQKEMQALADRCDDLRERKSAAAEEAVDCRNRLTALQSAPDDGYALLEAQRDEAMTCLADLEGQRDRAEEDYEAKVDEARRAEEQKVMLSHRMSALRAQLAGQESELESAGRDEGGHPAPVNRLLAAARMGQLNFELAPVSEIFTCPDHLVTALEAYLGGRLSWLVTDTVAQAGAAIDLLKKAQAGRATLLPLEKCRPVRHGVLEGDDVLGWAVDLIQPLPRWAAAAQHLLGGLLVVKTYKTAAELGATARFPIVTLEGEVFQPSGAISGGAHRRLGPLQAKQRRDTLKAALEAGQEGLEELKKRVGELTALLTDLEGPLARLRASADDARLKAEAKRRQVQELNSRLEELEVRRESRQARQAELTERLKFLESNLAAWTEELDALTGGAAEDAAPQLAAARSEAKLAASRAEAAREALKTWTKTALDDQAALTRLTLQHQALQAQIDEGRSSLDRLSAEKETLERHIALAEEELRQAEAAWARDSGGALRLVRHQEAAKERSKRLAEAAERAEIERGRTGKRLEELIAANEEKYPYAERRTDKEESPERLTRQLVRLERELKDLGAVNRGALDEDGALEKRLAFLGEQTADAKSACDGLRDLIADADKQAGEVFGAALEKIDARFDALFRRLFGGGEAHLLWDKSAGSWEGGVEITARPPGKRTLYLAQLSGGEQTLTALSLLFAAMETAQVPLAVLDEVDAALDEVNLGRFADLATQYAQGVQLLVMTHRRQTMERADRAFGVTMSEPGLSKVIGLKVDEWL